MTLILRITRHGILCADFVGSHTGAASTNSTQIIRHIKDPGRVPGLSHGGFVSFILVILGSVFVFFFFPVFFIVLILALFILTVFVFLILTFFIFLIFFPVFVFFILFVLFILGFDGLFIIGILLLLFFDSLVNRPAVFLELVLIPGFLWPRIFSGVGFDVLY